MQDNGFVYQIPDQLAFDDFDKYSTTFNGAFKELFRYTTQPAQLLSVQERYNFVKFWHYHHIIKYGEKMVAKQIIAIEQLKLDSIYENVLLLGRQYFGDDKKRTF